MDIIFGFSDRSVIARIKGPKESLAPSFIALIEDRQASELGALFEITFGHWLLLIRSHWVEPSVSQLIGLTPRCRYQVCWHPAQGRPSWVIPVSPLCSPYTMEAKS